jgi:hypothetical protein
VDDRKNDQRDVDDPGGGDDRLSLRLVISTSVAKNGRPLGGAGRAYYRRPATRTELGWSVGAWPP